MKVLTNGHGKVGVACFQIRNTVVRLGGEPLAASLALLLKARAYASDVQRSVWDFAIEIHRLRATGVTDCDLRWLYCKGHIEHAIEVTVPEQCRRSFRAVRCLTFFDKSCFALTEEGAAFATQVARRMAVPTSSNGGRCNQGVPWEPRRSTPATKPCWDAVERELCVGHALVKRFRVPAANQELVLSAFEEEGWPKRIDDPLSPAPEIDPKRRLHSTIQCLNRNQKCRLVHFHGDGYGRGVRWVLRSADEDCDRHSLPASRSGDG
jgi:hypothetical protein